MKTILISLGIVAVLIMLLKFWNKYSLIYNHGILKKSKCKNCIEILGAEALENAIIELENEKKRYKHEAKIGTVKLHNMKLICPNCGTENFERDLYKARREYKKIKNDTPTKPKAH